jgi:hypothetical protein
MTLVVIIMGALVGTGLKVMPVVVVAGLAMIICLEIMSTGAAQGRSAS